MTNIAELQNAFEAIVLFEMRNKNTRDERIARIMALWCSPAAAGLSSKQRNAIADQAIRNAVEILDEVYFSDSGRWQ